MNTTISFNLAKLLKEKGFDLPCTKRYNKNGRLSKYTQFPENYNTDVWGEEVSAPEHSQVVMWIYEKHGIWIWVSMELGFNTTFCWQLTGESTSSSYNSNFKTPTEAYLGAIEYTLTNLI